VRRIVVAMLVLAVAAGAAAAWRYWAQFEPVVQNVVAAVTGNAAASTPAQAPKQQAAPPVAVVTAPVARKAMPVKVETIGTVQPIATVSIKARIDGQIVQVHINEGQEVKTGDLLFTLDSRAIEAQIRQTEAVVARDRAQLAQSRRDLERLTELAAKEYAARTRVDELRTQGAALEAGVKASEASTENLRVQLSHHSIKAPIDGRVGAIALKTGNVVKNNEATITTINQIKPIYVSFSVPQDSLPEIREAMTAGPVMVSASPPGDTEPPATGQLAFVDNAIDAATGTINLKAVFPNQRERLWPGQFANVAVTLKVEADAVVVPSAAVQIGQNGPYVFTVGPENTAVLKQVAVARQVGNETVIASGLQAGETVVTDGAYRLFRGAKVTTRGGKPGQTS
jgi:membrane fusion protein, multidrug efflux system